MPTFLFLHSETPWVHTLAARLADRHAVHATLFTDWLVEWSQGVEWPIEEPSNDLQRTKRVLPTGYAGILSWFARPYLQWTVNTWRQELRKASGTEPFVVVCYPWAESWVRDVPPERLVYYNLDEYTLYRPERADTLREQEARLVNRAGTTVCLSRFQVEQLRERHPERANRIHHFPLGVRASFLNESPAHPPEPNTVVYIGNVGDRVDWGFFDAVASRCPDLTFRIVGGPIPEKASEDWECRRRTVVGRPNVEAIGRVPQDEVPAYYQRHAVNWIPYDLDHPFNRASCPTKIMDGLASGRPVASTSVPECTAYPQWIDLADDPDDMAEVLKRSAAPDAHDPERSRRQVSFAHEHVWSERAETFERLLRTSDMEGATPASP